MNHFKIKAKENKSIVSSLGIFTILFNRGKVNAVLNPRRDKLGDNWVIEFNTFAERTYYRNKETGECLWHMPDEVKFFLPRALENKLLKVFDFYEIDEMKKSFALLDMDNSGDLSDVEIKLLLNSMGIKIDEKKLKKLMKAIDTNNNGTIEFDEFCWMMFELRKKERKRQEQLESRSPNSSEKSRFSFSFSDTSALYSDDNFNGKFSLNRLHSAVNRLESQEIAHKRRGSSISISTGDDSSATSDTRSTRRRRGRGVGCLPCLRRRKVATEIDDYDNSEMDNSGVMKRRGSNGSIDSLGEGSFRQSSFRSGSVEEKSSFYDGSIEGADGGRFVGVVRSKSQFQQDLSGYSEDNSSLAGRKAAPVKPKKHDKHCFCGCRRF
jgi:Ca2+-binding EF-hand superfamily protein